MTTRQILAKTPIPREALSLRVSRALERSRVTHGILLSLTENELSIIRNIGDAAISEIRAYFKSQGLDEVFYRESRKNRLKAVFGSIQEIPTAYMVAVGILSIPQIADLLWLGAGTLGILQERVRQGQLNLRYLEERKDRFGRLFSDEDIKYLVKELARFDIKLPAE